MKKNEHYEINIKFNGSIEDNASLNQFMNCVSSVSRRLPHEPDEIAPIYDEDYLWELEDDPLVSEIAISPELVNLGIQYMVLFDGNLIFETEHGIVFLSANKEGLHSLFHPLKSNSRDHARVLSKITYNLTNTKQFNLSLKERMNYS